MNHEPQITNHEPRITNHEPRITNDIIQSSMRRRSEIARLSVENARLRAALAWAWFAIATLVLGVCYLTLVAYQMEVCR